MVTDSRELDKIQGRPVSVSIYSAIKRVVVAERSSSSAIRYVKLESGKELVFN